MAEPLIVLQELRREFPSGDGTLVVLKDIDLTIERGEMVAIMGASGSGKSTLMNILGCLDRPTGGRYLFAGRNVGALSPDDLAALRRDHFGFIFQRYHLLSDLTALENVAVPAVYAHVKRAERDVHASALLDRLGLSDRKQHRPNALSGGQQQRVSIARALMNDGDVILADEPTGALDTQSGQDVLQILDELHAAGKTIILVTHDPSVAARAHRIIGIGDGRILSDQRKTDMKPVAEGAVGEAAAAHFDTDREGVIGKLLDRYGGATRTALLTMRANPLRTFLTMLGIIVGIASVVSVVALGQGSRQRVLSQIRSLGTNTLEIFPGKNFGDVRSNKIRTLVLSDAKALEGQPYVAGVTPTVNTQTTLRYDANEASALVNGVGAQYFEVRGSKLDRGRFFGADAVKNFAQDAVIDANAREALFPQLNADPVGKVIWVGDLPCRVIGVMAAQSGGFGASQNPSVYLPYTTVQARISGTQTLRSILLRVSETVTPAMAEQSVTRLLRRRHGTTDFFILNTDDIRQTIDNATQTLSLLILCIALISLVVGGIGVMNIMVVSVTERTGEIGIRMAVGARRSDILEEVLIEAVLICLLAGLLGIAVAFTFGMIFNALGFSFTLIYSATSMVAAFACSTLIGIAFGYLPARNASRLDPVAALARE